MASIKLAVAASGQSQVIAAQAGKRIRVFGVYYVCRVATDVKFQSAATDITGTQANVAGGGVAWCSANERCLFECVVGEALNIVLNVANDVGGVIQYDVV